jgi:hypothetical protein
MKVGTNGDFREVALQSIQKVQMRACICCANGMDLPEGEWCRACNRGIGEAQHKAIDDSPLGAAIRSARGGDAPVPKRGFA